MFVHIYADVEPTCCFQCVMSFNTSSRRTIPDFIKKAILCYVDQQVHIFDEMGFFIDRTENTYVYGNDFNRTEIHKSPWAFQMQCYISIH